VVDYCDFGSMKTTCDVLSDMRSSIIMEKILILSACYGSWLIYFANNRFKTISLIVLTSFGFPLFNTTQMNDTCCFEEDVEHAFRLKPVASYYGFWTFTFTNPTSVSRLVSNLSQIKPLLIPIKYGLNRLWGIGKTRSRIPRIYP
jgi:hypothetical protein